MWLLPWMNCFGSSRTCRAARMLADAPSLQQVHATLCGEFDAPAERIQADLLALVQELAVAGLVEIA